MYNSWWKYELKKILGRRNDAWYFDRMCKTYMRRNSFIQREKVYNNARLLLTLEHEQKDARDVLDRLPGFKVNPIYDQAYHIRQKKMEEQSRKHAFSSFAFIFHLPGAAFSMGAHSWFSSIMMGMQYQGIDVSSFWHRDKQPRLMKDKINFIITGYSQTYIEQINWDYLKSEREKGVKCVVLFSIPLNQHSIQVMKDMQAAYDTFCSVQFYTFHDHNFEPYDGFKADCKHHGFVVYHIPFAANPLFHFSSPVISEELDYVFLGSANFDKINRYNIFFNKLIHHYVGLIDGPGWPWSSKFQYASSIDKYIYAQSKIALNLHIDEQIREPRELNERTYILAACGITQVIDNPAILKNKMPLLNATCSDTDYYSDFYRLLNSSERKAEDALRLIEYIYDQETVFDRINSLMEKINL